MIKKSIILVLCLGASGCSALTMTRPNQTQSCTSSPLAPVVDTMATIGVGIATVVTANNSEAVASTGDPVTDQNNINTANNRHDVIVTTTAAIGVGFAVSAIYGFVSANQCIDYNERSKKDKETQDWSAQVERDKEQERVAQEAQEQAIEDHKRQLVEEYYRRKQLQEQQAQQAQEEAARQQVWEQARARAQAEKVCACYTKKHCSPQVTCAMVSRCVSIGGQQVCEPKQQCSPNGKITCKGTPPPDCHPEGLDDVVGDSYCK
jgi:hypothetical protein